MSRPLSRVPFRWLEPTFPYLCVLRFAMGTLVDNGGCSFDGEIKNWMPFRQKLCRSSDGMGLGWVYEITNVLSAYLQKVVPEMSKKDREAGGIVTDFSKNVGTVLSKSQGSFLLMNPHQTSQRYLWVKLHGPCQMWIQRRGRAYRNP